MNGVIPYSNQPNHKLYIFIIQYSGSHNFIDSSLPNVVITLESTILQPYILLIILKQFKSYCQTKIDG